jgi:hypothetical protein
MNKAFWQLTLNAHINSSMQMLCRAYDRQPTSLHLHSWLLTIQKNLYLFDKEEFRKRMKDNPLVESLAQRPRKPDQAVLGADIRSCSPDDPLVKTLIIHRNSHVAHKAARWIIIRRNIHDDYPLVFGDFEALLDRAKAILNRYSSLFGATTYSTQMVGRDDFQYIFKCVEKRLQQEE